LAKQFKQLSNAITCIVCGNDVEEPHHKYCTIHMDLAPRIPWYKRTKPDNLEEDYLVTDDWDY
jgi:hypothetical protein